MVGDQSANAAGENQKSGYYVNETEGTDACTSVKKFQEYRRDSERARIEYAEEIGIRIRDIRFRIPHGYMRYWFKPEHLEEYSDDAGNQHRRTRFGQTVGEYNFWFPDGNWPEFRGSRPIFWGCDDPERFMVRIRVRNPFLGEALTHKEPPDYLTPNRKWANFLGGGERYLESIGDKYTSEQQHGLLRVYRKSVQHLSTARIRYRLKEGDQRQLYLTCAGSAHVAPYHTCSGYVYWSEDGLGMDIRFLKEALPHWEAIIEQARTLAVDWRDAARK